MLRGEPGYQTDVAGRASLAEALFCSPVFLMMSVVAFSWLCKHDLQKQLSGVRVYLDPQHQGLSSGSLDPMYLEEHHGMGNMWHSKPFVPNTESRRWVGARCVPQGYSPKTSFLHLAPQKGTAFWEPSSHHTTFRVEAMIVKLSTWHNLEARVKSQDLHRSDRVMRDFFNWFSWGEKTHPGCG